jgi:orotidine-5'-phosphate decarboxylase
MGDLDLTNRTSSQTLKDQIVDAGVEAKERAGAAVRASADVARDKVQEATEAAKSVVSDTADKIQSRAREQQESGADFVGRLAADFREAARAFERDVPFAARGINSAADYVEDAAGKVRNGSLRGLADGATEFARRQPAAFLGLSMLAGFVAVRFLRASGEQSSSSQ